VAGHLAVVGPLDQRPFCGGTANRLRITADGVAYTCCSPQRFRLNPGCGQAGARELTGAGPGCGRAASARAPGSLHSEERGPEAWLRRASTPAAAHAADGLLGRLSCPVQPAGEKPPRNQHGTRLEGRRAAAGIHLGCG